MLEHQNGGRVGEFERVSALREETLEMLGRCSRGEYVASEIIVALQHAANDLATVQDALRLDARPALEPAPIADA
jgi:hypothetical protein